MNSITNRIFLRVRPPTEEEVANARSRKNESNNNSNANDDDDDDKQRSGSEQSDHFHFNAQNEVKFHKLSCKFDRIFFEPSRAVAESLGCPVPPQQQQQHEQQQQSAQSRQEELFDTVGRPMVDAAILHEQDSCFIICGAHQSGRRYTMFGDNNANERGLLHRVMAELLARRSHGLNDTTTSSDSHHHHCSREFFVTFSALYDGKLLDLLPDPPASSSSSTQQDNNSSRMSEMPIRREWRENARGFFIPNENRQQITVMSDFDAAFTEAMRRLRYLCHDHTYELNLNKEMPPMWTALHVVRILCHIYDSRNPLEIRETVLTFVVLPPAQPVQRSEAATAGLCLSQLAANTALNTLLTVITKLGEIAAAEKNEQNDNGGDAVDGSAARPVHVPFRATQITRILKKPLSSGQCHMNFIFTAPLFLYCGWKLDNLARAASTALHLAIGLRRLDGWKGRREKDVAAPPLTVRDEFKAALLDKGDMERAAKLILRTVFVLA